jgi:hypothetical protein
MFKLSFEKNINRKKNKQRKHEAYSTHILLLCSLPKRKEKYCEQHTAKTHI